MLPNDSQTSVYIGKTTSMCRRVADYLEMVRRLRARYRRFAVKEDKNPYRFVHYAIAASAECGGVATIEYYNPQVLSEWELERLELQDLAAHVNWATTLGVYDFKLLNALPTLKRFAGPLQDSRWATVRLELPRLRQQKQAA